MSTDWNPYKQALNRLQQKNKAQLVEYMALRLSGREADPPYNWPRNEEAPEDFLVWAYNSGGAAWRMRFDGCLSELLQQHFAQFGQIFPGGEQVVSGLLHVAAAVKSPGGRSALQDALIDKRGLLKMELASKLASVQDVPWSQTLLHQALAVLSVLEKELPRWERQARESFWEPLMTRLPPCDELPVSLQAVAIRALARLDWRHIRVYLKHFMTGLCKSELERGRPEQGVAQELAGVLNFLVQESKLQEAAEDADRRVKHLLEDTTPISLAFHSLAADAQVIRVLQMALRLIGDSEKTFAGDLACQKRWKQDYEEATITSIYDSQPNVLACLQVREAMRRPTLIGRLGGLRFAIQRSRASVLAPAVVCSETRG